MKDQRLIMSNVKKYFFIPIGSNDSLEILDLSWNNFRNKSAKEIALGVKVNDWKELLDFINF